MGNHYDELFKDKHPLSFREIVDDWEKNSKEWYHATVAIEDLPLVLNNRDLKIYAWCRCDYIDGVSSYSQWHGLLHFSGRKCASWKMYLLRNKIRFSSTKNVFRKVYCLEHVVGVLRYISCAGGPGHLLPDHHKHYSNRLFDSSYFHEDIRQCRRIRKDIAAKISSFVDTSKKSNWTKDELHDKEKCLCKNSQDNDIKQQFRTDLLFESKLILNEADKCTPDFVYIDECIDE